MFADGRPDRIRHAQSRTRGPRLIGHNRMASTVRSADEEDRVAPLLLTGSVKVTVTPALSSPVNVAVTMLTCPALTDAGEAATAIESGVTGVGVGAVAALRVMSTALLEPFVKAPRTVS